MCSFVYDHRLENGTWDHDEPGWDLNEPNEHRDMQRTIRATLGYIHKRTSKSGSKLLQWVSHLIPSVHQIMTKSAKIVPASAPAKTTTPACGQHAAYDAFYTGASRHHTSMANACKQI